MDNYPWQYGIEYGAQRTPEGVRALLKKLGVTHVQYAAGKSNAAGTLGGDILFHEFASSIATDRTRAGSGHLVTVPDAPSREPFDDKVAVLTCNELPQRGLYTVKAMDRYEYGPDAEKFETPLQAAADMNAARALLAQATYAVVEARCFRGRLPAELSQHFELFVKRRRDPREIWRRSSEASARPQDDSEEGPSPEPSEALE
jgi:hypothetical protein